MARVTLNLPCVAALLGVAWHRPRGRGTQLAFTSSPLRSYKHCGAGLRSRLEGSLQTKGVAMTKKILVVEDDTDNRRIVTKVLSDEGYLVIEAVDGHEALAKARSERPAINSIARYSTPLRSSKSYTATIFGWRSRAEVCTSALKRSTKACSCAKLP